MEHQGESGEPSYVTIRDLPDEERPRERLAKYGADAVTNTELIAILLRTGSARESALSLANRLLSQFGVRGIAKASVEELAQVKGIGLAKAAQLKAAFELGKRLATTGDEARRTIQSPQHAADLVMEDLRYRDREHFQIILLDTRNCLIGTPRTVAVGGLNVNRVEPREIFKEAITHSAHAVILVHNHPSGDPTPSADDRALTQRLLEAGKLMGIQVLDHVIIGDGKFASLKEKQMM